MDEAGLEGTGKVEGVHCLERGEEFKWLGAALECNWVVCGEDILERVLDCLWSLSDWKECDRLVGVVPNEVRFRTIWEEKVPL